MSLNIYFLELPEEFHRNKFELAKVNESLRFYCIFEGVIDFCNKVMKCQKVYFLMLAS